MDFLERIFFGLSKRKKREKGKGGGKWKRKRVDRGGVFWEFRGEMRKGEERGRGGETNKSGEGGNNYGEEERDLQRSGRCFCNMDSSRWTLPLGIYFHLGEGWGL